jgi:hypothetical protein
VTPTVPQESHLGPLCFIWFVNRISDSSTQMKSCQWVPGLFDNSIGSKQIVRVVRQKLNVGKCKTITISRSSHPVEFSYMLGGNVLDWVSSINDLGVIMDEKMTFSKHVDVMVAKVFRMLGFIRRLSLEFRDLYTLHVSGSSKTRIRKLRE